jgi:hypothetical protein
MSKAIRCLFVGLLICLIYTPVNGESSEPLGTGHLSIKVNQIDLRDESDIWQLNDLDTANYVALDWYGNLGQNFYIGGELGHAKFTGEAMGTSTEITMMPLELNLKYVLDLVEAIQLDFGVGVSYTYLDGKVAPGTITGIADDEFIGGAQGFVNFNFVFKRWFIGANATYQVTKKLTKGVDLDNYRYGIHVGFKLYE